jgi:NADH-quinone oxidoreductase subunit L
MHETSVEYLRWIPLLPLLGAAVNGILNRRLPRPLVALIGVGSVAAAFAMAVRGLWQLRGLPPAERVLHDVLFQWIPVGGLHIDAAFLLDPLSAAMAVMVTGVSLLIHLYSVGYMREDAGFQRFFAYLNLFVFAMLVLVTADNLALLFVGWEGVGLCSYLLIGFWFGDLANSAAGKKAFVMNRVGDFGFLLGMLVIVKALDGHAGGGNVLAFSTMAAHTDLLAPVATAAGLLLFLGATGKSAQIPLFTWLPDAMAGPTPVSALIHAATMVTAGVYMIARMHFLYELSSVALQVIAIVGVLTALVAATIALAQTDIKKVLAYSTVSQLGYMMLACGVGAFGVGIFHVLTHAFFKALLFLGAGSVIHAMHHEQDMRKMGALRSRLPVTFATMAAATLAIAGVFPFAGFFSKDEILSEAFLGSPALWLVGFVVAGLTAFYMARLMMLTFFGESRVEPETASHVHESPAVMTIPLVILALLSFVGGWMGWPSFLGGGNALHHWLEPVFAGTAGHALPAAQAAAETAHEAGTGAAEVHGSVATEWILAVLSLALALGGLWLGRVAYAGRSRLVARARELGGGVPFHVLEGKYYIDEIYEAILVKPAYWISDRVLWRVVDAGLIDGVLVNGPARFLSAMGQLVRLIQNGMLRWYAYSFAAGVLAVILYLVQRVN